MNLEPIARLIDDALKILQARFYRNLSVRIWMRDRNELTKSLARYGHECVRRGWDLSAEQISRDLLGVVRRMTPPERQWMPRYLESCVDLHIRSRAEELSAQSKSNALQRVVNRVKDSLVPSGVVVREKTAVEVLSDLYQAEKSVKRLRHHKSDLRKSEAAQMKLL